MTAWLDDEEAKAWRGLINGFTAVRAELDEQMTEQFGLAAGDYGVLVSLSESESGNSLRMCDLAGAMHLSPSGLTRRLDGLVKRGLVARTPSVEDRRVIMAVLTDAGKDLLAQAAPVHVEGVRRAFFDHLSRTQIRNIGAAFDALVRGRAAARCPSGVSDGPVAD
ncbi:MAG: MarR family winged helix-turn-helix transcriptional regulator [Acidimicrobiia bacterium]